MAEMTVTAELEPWLLRSFRKFPLELVRGQDVYVWDTQGRRYLDMYAGHAVTSTGHCHPHVVKAIQEQAAKLIFYSNVAGLPLREEAARMLVERAPGFSHAFFANSGAEANENALKMARRQTGRHEIVAMLGGFHGRTAGAVSVTGVEKYRKQSEPNVPGAVFIPFGDLDAAKQAITTKTAAVILEPIQSMAGIKTAPASYFQGLRAACDAAGAVLIYDEVQTGIGRTGTMVFSGRHGVRPDLVTLAKGIASGVPLSAVLVCPAMAAKVQYGEYGATFGAGPLAMAAMKATLEVIEREKLLDNVEAVGAHLAERLRGLKGVKEVRGLGFLAGVKIDADASSVQRRMLERRVVLGTADEPGVLRLLPPLTLSKAHVDEFVGILGEVLNGA
jgi:acetylornithine aminotransferase/acetylornithine/N-succinyldiaminopimelate aminotransferase